MPNASFPENSKPNELLFSVRQHIAYTLSALYAIARPSVCLFVRHTGGSQDQSKTVEVRIMLFSPYASPIPLVFAR